MGSLKSINYKGIEIKTSTSADVGQEIIDFLIHERLLISMVDKDKWRDIDRINKEKQLFKAVGLAVHGSRYRAVIRGQKVEINYVCPGKETDKSLEILMVYPLTVKYGNSGIKISIK